MLGPRSPLRAARQEVVEVKVLHVGRPEEGVNGVAGALKASLGTLVASLGAVLLHPVHEALHDRKDGVAGNGSRLLGRFLPGEKYLQLAEAP
jgi:hypothetical protein